METQSTIKEPYSESYICIAVSPWGISPERYETLMERNGNVPLVRLSVYLKIQITVCTLSGEIPHGDTEHDQRTLFRKLYLHSRERDHVVLVIRDFDGKERQCTPCKVVSLPQNTNYGMHTLYGYQSLVSFRRNSPWRHRARSKNPIQKAIFA
jgi:hypothetical protein